MVGHLNIFRREGESLVITDRDSGEVITITATRTRANKVKLCVSAERERYQIDRSEVALRRAVDESVMVAGMQTA